MIFCFCAIVLTLRFFIFVNTDFVRDIYLSYVQTKIQKFCNLYEKLNCCMYVEHKTGGEKMKEYKKTVLVKFETAEVSIGKYRLKGKCGSGGC